MELPLATVQTLDQITIASPCSASWSDMRGNGQVRFCDHCRQNVYNISEMSSAEALALIQGEETGPCLRLYRRYDGTVKTADCPPWLMRVWIPLCRTLAFVGGAICVVLTLVWHGDDRVTRHRPISWTTRASSKGHFMGTRAVRPPPYFANDEKNSCARPAERR
jgi:hypothetical protein